MMGSSRGVPNLVISQHVIDKMAAAARHFLEDETGEAMIGFVEPGIHTGGVPTIYVMDTISPDESAVREMHTFQQGDARQDDLIWWIQTNWNVLRKDIKAGKTGAPALKWDIPVRYLGDWHKQPGYMIAPSGGDLRTALEWLAEEDPDKGLGFLLVPIVTLGHPAMLSGEGVSNYIALDHDDGYMRVDWWYISFENGLFQPIVPVIYQMDQLPRIMDKYPWHLVDDARFSIEIGQMEHEGLFVSMGILWDTDGAPPVEVCFIVARKGASDVLLVVTHYDFPKSAPKIYRAPFKLMNLNDNMVDMFGKLWEAAEDITDQVKDELDDPTWGEESYLLDWVLAAESVLGIEAPETTDDEDTDENADNAAITDNVKAENTASTAQVKIDQPEEDAP